MLFSPVRQFITNTNQQEEIVDEPTKEELITLLKEGKVGEFNEVRPNGKVDLQDANLWRTKLQGVDLRIADLQRANFRRVDLQDANLEGANFKEADMGGAFLQESNLRKANLRKANLSLANLKGANLEEADLGEANLEGANLEEADLGEANLWNTNLRYAVLDRANLKKSNLQKADLSHCFMLQSAKICCTNFEGAQVDWLGKFATWLSDPEALEQEDNVLLQNFVRLIQQAGQS